MFRRQCDNTTQEHAQHEFTKHWVKKDLPHLRNPELYPAEWDARYVCPGLVIAAWTVDYLHEDCTPCEACADMAIQKATSLDHQESVWRELGPGDAIMHMAEVKRI